VTRDRIQETTRIGDREMATKAVAAVTTGMASEAAAVITIGRLAETEVRTVTIAAETAISAVTANNPRGSAASIHESVTTVALRDTSVGTVMNPRKSADPKVATIVDQTLT